MGTATNNALKRQKRPLQAAFGSEPEDSVLKRYKDIYFYEPRKIRPRF